jgi:isoleucyl-tRNA synthetase
MKQITQAIGQFSQQDIMQFEQEQKYSLKLNDQVIDLALEDVEIISEDIPGWLVANEGRLTVALDITLTDELRQEGIAREFINRIQNIRKESGFEVTDKIRLRIMKHDGILLAVENFSDYIGSQTLAGSITLVDKLKADEAIEVVLDDETKTLLQIEKI